MQENEGKCIHLSDSDHVTIFQVFCCSDDDVETLLKGKD